MTTRARTWTPRGCVAVCLKSGSEAGRPALDSAFLHTLSGRIALGVPNVSHSGHPASPLPSGSGLPVASTYVPDGQLSCRMTDSGHRPLSSPLHPACQQNTLRLSLHESLFPSVHCSLRPRPVSLRHPRPRSTPVSPLIDPRASTAHIAVAEGLDDAAAPSFKCRRRARRWPSGLWLRRWVQLYPEW